MHYLRYKIVFQNPATQCSCTTRGCGCAAAILNPVGGAGGEARMWETQEEVRSAMLELKMFDTMEVVGQVAEEGEEEEEGDECSPQVG